MKILSPPVADGHVKLSEAQQRKVLQLLTAMNAAEATLAEATWRLSRYTAALRKRFERAVAAGRGPVDAYGDPLYRTCKCGKLIERYMRASNGERLGVGWPTKRHICPRGVK